MNDDLEKRGGDLVVQSKLDAQSPAQKEFSRLLAKIETEGKALSNLDGLESRFTAEAASRLDPINEDLAQAQRDMVGRLDDVLRDTELLAALTHKQQTVLKRLLIKLTGNLASAGDAQMAALHDQYSDESFETKGRAEVDELRDLMNDFGFDLGDIDPNATAEDTLAQTQAAMLDHVERLKAADDAREAKRAARAQARAKSDPKLQAKLDAKEQSEQDAKTALRGIYRQLASRLHPDRAQSDAERERFHDLMSRANVANDAKDLLGLLKLQIEAEQIDANVMQTVAEEQLRTWNRLLKEQAARLTEERSVAELRLRHSFNLPVHFPLTARGILHWIDEQEVDLYGMLNGLREDIGLTSTVKGLKQIAKEQAPNVGLGSTRRSRVDEPWDATSQDDLMGMIEGMFRMSREADIQNRRKRR